MSKAAADNIQRATFNMMEVLGDFAATENPEQPIRKSRKYFSTRENTANMLTSLRSDSLRNRCHRLDQEDKENLRLLGLSKTSGLCTLLGKLWLGGTEVFSMIPRLVSIRRHHRHRKSNLQI